MRTLSLLLPLALAACGGTELDTTTGAQAIRGSGFTDEDVDAILTELDRLDPDLYRVQLPVSTQRGTVQRSFGSLPMRRVEYIASTQNIRLDTGANILAVYESCTGGGSGSMTPSDAAAKAVGDRLDRILSDIDQDYYQFMR